MQRSYCSSSRRSSGRGSKHGCRQLYTAATLALCLVMQCSVVAGKCRTPPGASSDFIDPATKDKYCLKPVCVESYEKCCGRNPNACSDTGAPTETLELVFSDEFEGYGSGDIGTPSDVRWTAMDFHYSSDKNEWQNYKPEQVSVENGRLLLTLVDKNSSAIRHNEFGPDQVDANKTSGMLQSWNKFCFTGGLVEFSVQLPGTAQESGFWAATWLMGNLGRAGFYPSTAGMWPFSYDACATGDRAHDWNKNKTQRISRCYGTQGRGAPEIDILEYGKLGADGGHPTYVHTMQMGPVLPPFTSWMAADGKSAPGVKMPGQDTPFGTQLPDYRGGLTRDGFPRPGSPITDTYTGSSFLTGDSYFTRHHNYAVLWEPGEYVRWYLDDLLLFEVGKEALAAKASSEGLTVEQRLIPKEPMYLIMNLAMSNNAWAKVDPDLQYPGVMSVEHVRIWQRPGAINVGCDPQKVTANGESFPTAEYISCNRDRYVPESEKPFWKFAYCTDVRSQENQLLLGLGVSGAVVLLTATVLMLVMRRSFMHEQRLQEQVGHSLPAGTRPGGTLHEKIKGCYINQVGSHLEETLQDTRPDLLALAKAAAAAQAKAAGG